MNATEELIIRAVATRKVTRKVVKLAQSYLEHRERVAACAAGRVASIEHHEKARRAEDAEREETSAATWESVLERTARDHLGLCACEACHRARLLEPHHLEPGSGNRRDAPEVVMALCADCHRLAPSAAHRRPRWFALNVVVAWCRAHLYPLPNRKEYRDA